MDATTLICGLGCIRAVWMQRFATVKSFITVYSILGMIQSMSYVYFSVTLTTLEKRFKIPGKTLVNSVGLYGTIFLLGIILSGNEVSQILLSLVLSYYGGTRNRPKWIAFGTLSSALSCFVLALPHLLYGPGEDAIRLTRQYIDATGADISFISQYGKHEDPILHCHANKPPQDCDANSLSSDYSVVPLVLIFLSQFILGIGTTLYYVLGQTYIDDNTDKADAPRLLGISMALRMVGPTFGYLLGFLCLRLYIDPSLDPIIKHDDPRWMGAWWIGWIFCGLLMAVSSIILAMFPRELPSNRKVPEPDNYSPVPLEDVPLKSNGTENALEITPIVQRPNNEANFKEFPNALKRLLKNKILMNNIFSTIFAILGASMFITYFIKYIEVQFHRSSAKESIVAGPIILTGSLVGLLGSGIFISKFKPPPKYLLMWNVFGGLGFIAGQIVFIFLGCDSYNLQSYATDLPNTLNFNAQCNSLCDCTNVKFAPVCYQPDKITYFSPCHAGCTTVMNNSKSYSDCSCVPGDRGNTSNWEFDHILKNGFCDSSCNTAYYSFVIILAFINFSGSSGKIGNMLVNYRAVDVKDKAFAQGFALWMVSLFALIPGPIIYGWIFDNACLIWDQRCEHKGNCWYYEKDKLRLTLNLTGIGFTSIATFFDFMVWKTGKSLNFYTDNAFFPVSKKSADEKDQEAEK